MESVCPEPVTVVLVPDSQAGDEEEFKRATGFCAKCHSRKWVYYSQFSAEESKAESQQAFTQSHTN